MHAAAAGKSTIGIPQSVGREFAESDPGDRLPERKQAGGGIDFGPSYDPGKSFAQNVLDPRGLQAAINIGMGFSGGGLGTKVLPPAKGMTRLYRVEIPQEARVPMQDWVKQAQDESGMTAAYDRWFTHDPSMLDWYRQDAGVPTVTTHLDVPTQDLNDYRVSNQPWGVRRFSRDPDNEFFLPQDLANQRMTLPGSPSEPEGGFISSPSPERKALGGQTTGTGLGQNVPSDPERGSWGLSFLPAVRGPEFSDFVPPRSDFVPPRRSPERRQEGGGLGSGRDPALRALLRSRGRPKPLRGPEDITDEEIEEIAPGTLLNPNWPAVRFENQARGGRLAHTGKTASIAAAIRRAGTAEDPEAAAVATRVKMIGRKAVQEKAVAARAGKKYYQFGGTATASDALDIRGEAGADPGAMYRGAQTAGNVFSGAGQALGEDLTHLAQGFYEAGPGTVQRVWEGQLPPGAPETEQAARQTALAYGMLSPVAGTTSAGLGFSRGLDVTRPLETEAGHYLMPDAYFSPGEKGVRPAFDVRPPANTGEIQYVEGGQRPDWWSESAFGPWPENALIPMSRSRYFNLPRASTQAPDNLRLVRDEEQSTPNIGHHIFNIHDLQDNYHGYMSVTRSPWDSQSLNVEMINSIGGPGYIGHGQMRDLGRQLREQFPGVKTVGGYRVSGARRKTGMTGQASVRLPAGGFGLPPMDERRQDTLTIDPDYDPYIRRAAGGGVGLGARPRLQFGGMSSLGRMTSGDMPYWTRAEARIDDQPFGGGMIPSSSAGRTDQLPLAVATESHVIPAAEMAGLGQGNSLAGAAVLSRALNIGPWGIHPLPAHHGRGMGIPEPPPVRYARPAGLEPGEPYVYRTQAGGSPHSEGGAKHTTSILAAGGEYVVPREDWLQYDHHGQLQLHAGVRSIGEGDIAKGHEILNQMIKNIRNHTIKFLKTAPPPKS